MAPAPRSAATAASLQTITGSYTPAPSAATRRTDVTPPAFQATTTPLPPSLVASQSLSPAMPFT
ncbi:MAG: serine/threonine protein kinase, partial [Actinobacteria bacterium]|nr:serine/threonine protein kinase [Actinomycetota bacterium]